jgi:hypothetical protein
MHCGASKPSQPLHLSGKTVGYQTAADFAINSFTFLGFFFCSQSSIQFQNLLGKFFRIPYISLLLALTSFIGETDLRRSAAACVQEHGEFVPVFLSFVIFYT